MSSKRAKGKNTKGKNTKKRPQRATSNVFAMFDQSQIQEFKEAFNMIDQNRDGFIDKEDLHDMLASLGPEGNKTLALNSVALQKGQYRLVGNMIALCLVQGQVSPRFLSERLYRQSWLVKHRGAMNPRTRPCKAGPDVEDKEALWALL
ncbi:unnamed protein product [Boreogadus saida]